jgi:sulfite oxidase
MLGKMQIGRLHPDDILPDLPYFTREEIAMHKLPKDGIWMSYRDGVYDVTEFSKKHVWGGDAFMDAAGGAIDPYWTEYPVHKQPGITKMLRKMRIGNLHPKS